MNSESLAQASFAEPHDLLGALAGAWKGTCRTYFDEGVAKDESPINGTVELMLKDRFAVFDYESSFEGQPFRGRMTMGFERNRKRWEIAWTCGFHTGTAIQFSTGSDWTPGTNSFQVATTYPDGQGGPEWGWKTVVTLEGPHRLAIRMYNSLPDGTPAGGVQMELLCSDAV